MRRRQVFLSLVVILALCGLWVWLEVRSVPIWYAPPDPGDERVTARAESMEYRVVEQVQRIRPEEETWLMTIGEPEVNAWLAARLPAWVAHEKDLQWPQSVSSPQVRISAEGVDVAAELTRGEGRSHLVVAHVVPEIEEGFLRLKVDRVGLGRVRMRGGPIESLARLIEESMPRLIENEEEMEQLRKILHGHARVAAQFELSDGRRVEVQDLQLYDGFVEVTCRTLPRGLETRGDGDVDAGEARAPEARAPETGVPKASAPEAEGEG